MADPMTDAEIEGLMELCEKATPGPCVFATGNSWRRFLTDSGKPVCVPAFYSGTDRTLTMNVTDADGELMASAFSAMPRLIKEVEYWRAKARKYRALYEGRYDECEMGD